MEMDDNPLSGMDPVADDPSDSFSLAQSDEKGEVSTDGENPPLENWVVFTVTGEEFNPDVITMSLKIEPDRVYHPEGGNKKALWQMRSTLPATYHLEAHFWEILKRIVPVRKDLMRIARDAEILFYCTVRKRRNSKQRLDLSPKLLILVGHLGAGIRMDIELVDS